MQTQIPTPLTHGAWTIDPARSTVGFAIRHLGVANVRGRFQEVAARVDDTPGGPLVHGAMKTASIDTGDATRDRRLRDELFRSAGFPEIVFTAALDDLGDAHAAPVTGVLTICGVTRPLTLGVTAEPLDDGAVRVRAVGDLRRSDFGLEWEALGRAGERLVADRVHVYADVVAVAD